MSDTRDPRSVIDAAEQAAAAGDHASAERLLREAATIQEAALGPLHPDLANTLNNLGVVCEIVGKPDEAERCFRRAHAIATAALEADHPFVATSRKNLEDFCAARGKAVDVPKAPPLLTEILPGPLLTHDGSTGIRGAAESPRGERLRVEPPRTVDPPVTHDPPRIREPVRAPDPRSSVAERPVPAPAVKSSSGFGVGALVAGGLLVGFLGAAWWLGRNQTSESPTATAAPSSAAEPPAARPEPKPVAPPPKSEAGGTAPAKSPTGRAVAPAARTGSPAAAGPRPTVAELQLCRDRQGAPGSGAWRCDPVSRPAAPGRLVFYTRLKSPRDTTVQHRWYQSNRLRQSVDLTIRANPGSGYRTFSRNTVSPGEWRVELRSQDGALLHEERFTVR